MAVALAAVGSASLEARCAFVREHTVLAKMQLRSHRIDELILLFEEQLLTRQILAPKEVTLKLKDAEVRQAIAEPLKAAARRQHAAEHAPLARYRVAHRVDASLRVAVGVSRIPKKHD